MSPVKIDPITLEVVNNALHSIAEEIGLVLMRTSRCLVFREGGDLSCALWDEQGAIVAHGFDIPLHTGVLPFVVKKILESIPAEDFKPGDIAIVNQLEVGGSHLPDVKMVKPVYYEGDLVMWAGNVGHWPDIGGTVPGSYSYNATEIYQEGLQIPPCKIMKEGKIDREILEFILLNVRGREERLGDLWAQISACHVAEKRIHEIFDRYGKETMLQYFKDLMEYSEHRMRKEIEKIPRGVYSFEDYIDDDGIRDEPIKLKVQIEAKGDSIKFDFTGTDSQVKGPINLPYYPTISAVVYVMRCITDPTITLNDGSMRPIEVYAPEGTILNAKHPAPSVGWHETCFRIADLLLGAFSKVLPEKVTAACVGSACCFMFGGVDPRTNKQFQHFEPMAGGFGARSNKDGIDCMKSHIGNSANIPVEVMEASLPVLVVRYGIIPDSGGAGKYRGGCGIEKRVKFLSNATLSLMIDRVKIPPYGLFGGKPGKTAKLEIITPSEGKKILKSGKISIELPAGTVVSVGTPGSGGYGDPLDRDRSLVQWDVIEEKVPIKSARDDYGVVINPRTYQVDGEATEKLRREMRGT